MSRNFLDRAIRRVLGSFVASDGNRAKRRRPRHLADLECLEGRALLANITASAVISSTPSGADFNYTIVLKNSSASTSPIGTFWYAWIATPDQNYLATSPISVTPPAGWTESITHDSATDGFGIRFIASSAASSIKPGSSMSFKFQSADTPASVNGKSLFHGGPAVGTSFVYPQGPFSDAGHEFVVALASQSGPLVTVRKVTDVQNKSHSVTQITIAFSGPVNSTEAKALSTYRLVMAGTNGSFSAKNAKVIAIRSAVYDSVHHTVTLTPVTAFALKSPVQLTVNGTGTSGLQDTFRRLIDGNHDGKPGGNAVAILSQSGVVLK
jgi:hypothetical protein